MEDKVKLKRTMTEPEYRALPNVSYSKLSALDRSPKSLIINTFEQSEALIYGSAVDVLLFDGEEVFNKQFAVLTANKPSWGMAKIYEAIMSEIEAQQDDVLPEPLSTKLEDYSDIILRVARANSYGDGWHNPTIIKKVVEACQELYEFTINSKGKKLLSPEQYEYAFNSIQTLKTHEFTKHLFEENDNVDNYYQFPIEWEVEVNGVKVLMKSLLDILRIDHKNKTIEPKDLKTTGKSVLAFPSSFIEWRYYLQASSYSDAVRYLIKTHYPQYISYRILPFEFLVISSKNPTKPLMYKCTENDLYVGAYGGTVKSYDREIKGYLELVRDMIWHTENELYNYPKSTYEAKGNLELDMFKR